MGNRVSISATQDRQASRRSANIDRIIEEDSKKFRQECKLLLLGSEGSGKSTAVKQMKIAYDGFSVEERIDYRAAIYRNLLESAQALVFTMEELSIKPVDLRTRATAEHIASYELDLSSIDSNFRLSEQLALSINQLWRDPAIPRVVDRHSDEFSLMENASYFFAAAERIGSPDYVPTETDILMCRQETTGIVETKFDLPPLSINMLEVGGRSERHKWIHCFEDVTSIIFCAALSEYDQVLPEERNKNRMVESLELFDSVVNSRWFSRTSIILFLSKRDLLRNKLPEVPLERCFPEYTGGSDVDKATEYILSRFVQTNRSRLSIYAHLTSFTLATDFSNLRFVQSAVKDAILQNTLRASGIFETDNASPQDHVL